MQWRMLQQDEPQDFVIATGKQTSIRKFIELTAIELNWGEIKWEGKGINEIGRRSDTNQIVIRIDPKFFRPSEVNTLLGDPSKAHKKLGWQTKTSLESLISEMVKEDKENASREKI